MTELESKIVDRIIEKMDLDRLIDKIGLDVLTDRIAEKAAEKIVKMEYPDVPDTSPAPGTLPNPFTPGVPWTTPPVQIEPITVMYGVLPTQFKTAVEQTLGDQSSGQDSAASYASTTKEE